jgi:uncharacterized protein YnzC (UPF0291/DUF896 family)
MEQTKLDRINELARLSKTRALTPEEKAEQTRLRKEYIMLVHNNLRGQLENMQIQNPDGTIVNVRDLKKR